jgi:hypothetical protein
MAQGQTLSWIARKLKVNLSAISRTKDIMLNEPWNLIEEHVNSYGKTYTLTPAGYKILMAHNVKTQKNLKKTGLKKKPRDHENELSEHLSKLEKSESLNHYVTGGSRRVHDNVTTKYDDVKSRWYEHLIYRLHNKGASFEIIGPLTKKKIKTIYEGYVQDFHAKINTEMKNNYQLSVPLNADHFRGDVRATNVSFRLTTRELTIWAQLEIPFLKLNRNLRMKQLQNEFWKAITPMVEQLERNIRTMVPDFRLKRTTPGKFLVGRFRHTGDYALTNEKMAQRVPQGQKIEAYDVDKILSILTDWSMGNVPELEGVNPEHNDDYVDLVDEMLEDLMAGKFRPRQMTAMMQLMISAFNQILAISRQSEKFLSGKVSDLADASMVTQKQIQELNTVIAKIIAAGVGRK